MGKPLASRYHPGRRQDWIKVKNIRQQEVIICCRGISVTLVRTSGGRHYPPDILRRLMPPAASWKASQPAVSALARPGRAWARSGARTVIRR